MKHIIEHHGKHLFKGITLYEEFNEPRWVQKHRQLVTMAENNKTVTEIADELGYGKRYVQDLCLRYRV